MSERLQRSYSDYESTDPYTSPDRVRMVREKLKQIDFPKLFKEAREAAWQAGHARNQFGFGHPENAYDREIKRIKKEEKHFKTVVLKALEKGLVPPHMSFEQAMDWIDSLPQHIAFRDPEKNDAVEDNLELAQFESGAKAPSVVRPRAVETATPEALNDNASEFDYEYPFGRPVEGAGEEAQPTEGLTAAGRDPYNPSAAMSLESSEEWLFGKPENAQELDNFFASLKNESSGDQSDAVWLSSSSESLKQQLDAAAKDYFKAERTGDANLSAYDIQMGRVFDEYQRALASEGAPAADKETLKKDYLLSKNDNLLHEYEEYLLDQPVVDEPTVKRKVGALRIILGALTFFTVMAPAEVANTNMRNSGGAQASTGLSNESAPRMAAAIPPPIREEDTIAALENNPFTPGNLNPLPRRGPVSDSTFEPPSAPAVEEPPQ